MISRVFPATHPRAGQRTYFEEKTFSGTYLNPHATFTDAIINSGMYHTAEPKLHTIRENYDLWARRAENINKGEAVLSLRQWTGSPYNYKRDGSKPVEFMRMEKIGVQKIQIFTSGNTKGVRVEYNLKNIHEVANNDGLSVDDFCKWFKKDIEGVVIHFTENFRY